MDHITSLNIQGRLISSIVQILSKASIAHWAREIEKLPASVFIFVRKALQQQLPTASNLVRWGKAQDDSCQLCGQKQSNLHVLSNCSSPAALSRYKDRHDTILELLVNWIESTLTPEKKLYVDLEKQKFQPLSTLFQSYRPDIAIYDPPNIVTLELTVCHEGNILKSREYKTQKYVNLKENLHTQYSNCTLRNFTIEVSTLGFISDISSFCHTFSNSNLPDYIKTQLTRSAIFKSYSIYCSRNNFAVHLP